MARRTHVCVGTHPHRVHARPERARPEGARPADALGPGRLARIAEALGGRAAAVPDPAPPRIGPWGVVRELGRGGAGVVFEAWHAGGRGRAAVKLAFAHAAAAVSGEAELLGRFDHPAVVRRLGAGTHADGRPYVAMELVDGVSLAAHARALSGRGRLELFRDLCRAVAVVHRGRVVHGDLTPSNVAVRPGGRVVLLDFGSARGLDAAPGGRGPLTPEFAAPEQVLGAPTSAATDVYALGLVLHELLCGRARRLPWALCGGRPTVFDGVAAADVDAAGAELGRARRPRARPPRTLPRRARGGGLDWHVEALLDTALQTDPRDRYPTAADLAAAVDAALRLPAASAAAPLLP